MCCSGIAEKEQAAQQAARVPHRVLALHAGPVRHRRAGQQHRPHQVGPGGGHQHQRPAALAVADDKRPGVGVGVQRLHLLQELDLGAGHAFDGLARHRIGKEGEEVTRVAGGQRHADLAVQLEAADARAVAGARVDHHERALAGHGGVVLWRLDAHQRVVGRAVEVARVEHHIEVEHQHRWLARFTVRVVDVAAFAQRVPEQHRALPGIDPVTGRLLGQRRQRGQGPLSQGGLESFGHGGSPINEGAA